MRCKKFTVTSTDINVGDPIYIDVEMTLLDGSKKVPKSLIIQNDTDCELGLQLLDDDTEKALSIAHPEFYDYIPIDDGKSELKDPISLQYVVIKQLSGSATADLIFYGVNYF